MSAVQFVDNQGKSRLCEHQRDMLTTLKLVNVARTLPTETRSKLDSDAISGVKQAL